MTLQRAPLLILLALFGCSPVSQATAERQCLARAHSATGPHGSVAVGAGTGGVRSRVEIDISTDYLLGRDPAAIYDQCVLEKTGQPPSQPLYARSDWKG